MKTKNGPAGFKIRHALEGDCELILSFIKELAEYEKLGHEVVATPSTLRETLFCEQPSARVLIGEFNDQPIAYALMFYNFSSFTGRPGIYLEDIYVKPEMRGKGFGKSLLANTDPSIVAVASDQAMEEISVPVLDLNDVSAIGDFIIGYCGLDGKVRDGAA